MNFNVHSICPPYRLATPVAAIIRGSSLPSAMAALEEVKLRFTLRLRTIDQSHLLVRRIDPLLITRGRGTGTRQRTKTSVQHLAAFLLATPRPLLMPPHYTKGCRVDPTPNIDKETTTRALK
jgi:hypothetical protein